jgi:hypothetical protein
MKISVTISQGSKIVAVDFYPSDNVLWIKTNGFKIGRRLSKRESSHLLKLLTENPIGTFVNYLEKHEDIFIRNVLKGDYNEPQGT